MFELKITGVACYRVDDLEPNSYRVVVTPERGEVSLWEVRVSGDNYEITASPDADMGLMRDNVIDVVKWHRRSQ